MLAPQQNVYNLPNNPTHTRDLRKALRLLYENTIRDQSGLILLRSKVKAASYRMGFSASLIPEIEIVATELFTNQQKFANGSGVIQIWETQLPEPALDIFAIDYGPGINNIKEATEDGYTTAGTMGKGLGTITRFAHEHEFFSLPQSEATDSPWSGFAAWTRFYINRKNTKKRYEYGSFLRAYQDSPFNGDGIYLQEHDEKIRWLHVDGLGHGEKAANEIAGIDDVVALQQGIKECFDTMNIRLRGKRGLVAMLSETNIDDQLTTIGGVGDMTAWSICNGQKHAHTFSPGIIGHAHRSLETQQIAFPAQALFLTSTDGIRRNWSLDTLPSLWRKHPQFIAYLMGFVLGRSNDDRSLFVIRTTPHEMDS